MSVKPPTNRVHWRVVVGGSDEGVKRWPPRTYHSKSAARSRMAQIRAAHDLGVATIWILKDEEGEPTKVDGFNCEKCKTVRVLREENHD